MTPDPDRPSDAPTRPNTPRSLSPVGIGVVRPTPSGGIEAPVRSQTPGGTITVEPPKKLNPPPKPRGAYSVHGPAFPELTDEQRRAHPPMDEAETDPDADKTWVGNRPPKLAADSLRPGGAFTAERVAHARAVEANSRDAKQRAHLAQVEAREAKLEAREGKLAAQEAKLAAQKLATENARAHAEIDEKLGRVEKQLPDAARAGRIWAFATAAITGGFGALVAYYGYQVIHEQRLEREEDARVVPAPLPPPKVPKPSHS